MKFKQLKGKFKKLFKKVPSPKEVAGDVVDKVKDGENRIKHGVEETVKKSGDAVKKGVGDAVKASEKAVKKGVSDAVDKVKHKEDPDSSTKSTFKQENHSAFKDLEIPWFRRWYMFAFFYPTIISFFLEWLRREVQGG
ncbi:hypothetical protein HOG17_03085 [Candidatus Peregrinibacteria bacterium]|jgi:hypothetical protein|nr:hypothetical protein [Candidatus Peregrinibacteria bacterium]MBT4148675.1 hypothetical protein [Candidatus Peregrinibacteria bacterium]MBT4366517.1 hypothetical protein [Candidatus Peregrinibacteria bacterium]MBT4456044.1 hypothetical protein [Candidatus Peregrinibacteria bacterium]